MKKIITLLLLAFVSLSICASAQEVYKPFKCENVACKHNKNGYCTDVRKMKQLMKYKAEHGEQIQNTIVEQTPKDEEEAKRKAEIDSLLNIDYDTPFQFDFSDPEPYKWEQNEHIDASLDSLMTLFRVSTGADNVTTYIHKDINTSYKNNDFYFYFTVKDSVPGPMHFVAHYYADDPVKFHSLKFKIDQFDYIYSPTDIQNSNDGKYYAENFDNAMNKTDQARDLVAALGHCSYSNMVLVSNNVSHRIFFSEKQLQRFRATYQLYRLLGGNM